MKTIIKSGLVALALSMLLSASSAAQPRSERSSSSNGQRPDRNEWYQKMKAEKVAFFTTELSLTEAEAKAFWPIYDAAELSQREASRKVMESYKNLMNAVREDKPDSEIETLLNAYVQATQESRNVDPAVIAQYEKVLPAKKVAKIFIAEEKFRQQQIRQLHGQGGPSNGNNGGHGGPRGGFDGGQGGPRGGFDGGQGGPRGGNGFGGGNQDW